jgi:DedD protein
MDQGLKERLIGAAVLVALGVWLIPWVLDGKKEQVELDSSDAALRFPTPEEPLPVRSQTLSLDVPEPVVAPAETAAASRNTEPDANTVKPAPPAAEDAVVAQAESAPPPAAPQPSTAAAKPPAAAPQAAREAVRPDAKGDWVVQLGSFGEEANAKRLAQRVNTYGYKPDVSSHRAASRAMYRVRVGPYATRGQADATASALSAHGFTAQVVAAD